MAIASMSSASAQLPIGEIAAFLLSLHERAHELGYRELQRFALDELRKLVPFDAGVLATGTLQAGVPLPHDVLLHGLAPEFLESWDRVKNQDGVIIGAMQNPGRTMNHDVTRGGIYEEHDAIMEHSRRWGIMHVLCTTQVDQESGLYWVMPLSRANVDNPFTEVERLTTELVAPHLVTATRRARLSQLRAITRLVDSHGQAAALVNRRGLILEAEPALTGLLRRAWPKWSGPWMPPEVADAIASGSAPRLVCGRVVLRFNTVEDGLLLHVREALAADALTDREREIASAFSLGDTARQVAERLGVAPNTVRRHLANVYEKLGISSKAELDRMLRSVD
jgi:DNA-binding CsgD family transcriptional regulator